MALFQHRSLSYLLMASAFDASSASLTSAQEQAILKKHNDLRGAVSKPCTAADMEKLVWDTALATKAQSYADECLHGVHQSPMQPEGAGENLAMMSELSDTTITDERVLKLAQMWYDEGVDVEWTAGSKSIASITRADPADCASADGSKCVIGHYTAFVWSTTNKLGCGVKACTGGDWGTGGVNLVCKYTPGGNIGTKPPWIVGTACASCSGSCTDGLCTDSTAVNRCSDHDKIRFNGVDYTECSGAFAAMEKIYGASCVQGSTESICTQLAASAGCSWVDSACTAAGAGKKKYCAELNSDNSCDISCDVCTAPAGVGAESCGTSSAGTDSTGDSSSAGTDSTGSSSSAGTDSTGNSTKADGAVASTSTRSSLGSDTWLFVAVIFALAAYKF